VVQQNATANSGTPGNTSGDVTANSVSATICWASASCTGGAAKFGWSMNLPGTQTNGTTSTNEQIIYSPLVDGNAFVVNSIIPAINSPLSCTTAVDTGYTYAVSVMGGTAIPSFFTQYHDTQAIAEQANATGTSFPVTTADGQNWLVYQTVSNTPSTLQVTLGANYVGHRLTWVQLR
jgi:type IV pilus assembly protein PilY1